MGYKVLYRKYRPKTFNDIVDQKFITDTLRESIINNKISHAYIFSGPKGTGKTSTAKVLAKAINCESPLNGEPCGKCSSCINFTNNPDIIELDAASNNKVEDIREIINNVKLAPTSSKYKIYIIDEVHMLTNSASNAFLLTLEEPPSHAIFILATTNPESLPQTILSRCQHFAFSKISKKSLIDRIKFVLGEEKISLNDDIVEEIANLSDGGLRDALSILDQLVTLNKPITSSLLTEQFGVVSENSIRKLLDSILAGDIQEITSILSSFRKYGISEKSFINKFVSTMTEYACSLKQQGLDKRLLMFKQILNEILNLDVNHAFFNYYDVIEMIILSNLDTDFESNIPQICSDNKENEDTELKQEDNISINENYNIEENKKNSHLVNNDNFDEIKKIRINNSFVNATKSEKNQFVKNYKSYIELLKGENNIYSVIVDTEVGVVSPTNVLIVCNSEAAANLLNEQSNHILDVGGFNKKVAVFITENEWQKLMNEFQDKKKNNIKYEYISEPVLKADDKISDLAGNIFGSENIVVEE